MCGRYRVLGVLDTCTCDMLKDAQPHAHVHVHVLVQLCTAAAAIAEAQLELTSELARARKASTQKKFGEAL